MLTPQEIQDKKFEKAIFNGYDMGQVDGFLDGVLVDYTSLYQENAKLKTKMKILVDKIEEYRAVDEEMRKTLYTAQKNANELTETSQQKADELVEASQKKASELLESSRKEADELLESSKKKAEELLSTSRQQADEMLETSKQKSAELTESSKQKSEELLTTSQQKADELLATSKQQSEELLTASKQQSEELLATSKQQSEEMVTAAEKKAAELYEKAAEEAAIVTKTAREEADRLVYETQHSVEARVNELLRQSEDEKGKLDEVKEINASFVSKIKFLMMKNVEMLEAIVDRPLPVIETMEDVVRVPGEQPVSQEPAAEAAQPTSHAEEQKQPESVETAAEAPLAEEIPETPAISEETAEPAPVDSGYINDESVTPETVDTVTEPVAAADEAVEIPVPAVELPPQEEDTATESDYSFSDVSIPEVSVPEVTPLDTSMDMTEFDPRSNDFNFDEIDAIIDEIAPGSFEGEEKFDTVDGIAAAINEAADLAAAGDETPEESAAFYEPTEFEEPMYEAPSFDTPIFEQPMYEAPSFDAPIFDEPAAEMPEPIIEPAPVDPAPVEPVAAAPLDPMEARKKRLLAVEEARRKKAAVKAAAQQADDDLPDYLKQAVESVSQKEEPAPLNPEYVPMGMDYSAPNMEYSTANADYPAANQDYTPYRDYGSADEQSQQWGETNDYDFSYQQPDIDAPGEESIYTIGGENSDYSQFSYDENQSAYAENMNVDAVLEQTLADYNMVNPDSAMDMQSAGGGMYGEQPAPMNDGYGSFNYTPEAAPQNYKPDFDDTLVFTTHEENDDRQQGNVSSALPMGSNIREIDPSAVGISSEIETRFFEIDLGSSKRDVPPLAPRSNPPKGDIRFGRDYDVNDEG